jgi:hypothetical protein
VCTLVSFAWSPQVLPEEQRTDQALPRSGNALTDFFLRDVEITQFQFNLGQQLMSLGIVLLEVRACDLQALWLAHCLMMCILDPKQSDAVSHRP